MRTDYSEQDTERARQIERSSAGQATQALNPLPSTEAVPVHRARGQSQMVALALIVIGILLLLGRVLPDPGELMGGIVLFTIASCFLFFAFWQRVYGLLIPGCILAGLSVGVAFAATTGGVSVLWGLALGFLAILLLGRSLFNVQSNWPAYPAVPLFAVGVITAMANSPWSAIGLIWLPFVLIGVGLYLGRGRHP